MSPERKAELRAFVGTEDELTHPECIELLNDFAERSLRAAGLQEAHLKRTIEYALKDKVKR